MGHAKITRLPAILIWVEGMNKAKNVAIDVKFTWIGKDFGALVVVIC